MTIRLALPPAEAELELVIEDAGNPPLDVTSITALFEGLPWIYFESPDGSPLTARFGADRLPAPRYDLEAMRPAVMRGSGPSPSSASWGDRQPESAVAAPVATGAGAPSGAALDLAGFRVSRPLPPGPAGLTALRLDAAVLAASPHLSDVRIATADGRQVPVSPRDARRAARPEAPRSAEARRTPGRAAAPERRAASRSTGSSCRSRASRPRGWSWSRRRGSSRRRVGVLRERLGGRPETAGTFAEVAWGAWESADPERKAPALLVELPAGEGRELFVSIDDGDNAPVPLVRASLLLPAHRLRFVRQEGVSLTLVYGQAGLAPPRYDLELLAPRLLGAPAIESTLPPVAPETVEPEKKAGPKLFWAALVGAVVALLVLVARLLRRDPGPEKPEVEEEGPREG